MKIITFKGGLGNQIFEFAFYLYLKKHTKDRIYGYYNKKWLKGHNGLEIHNVFDVELPKSNIITDLIAYFIRSINRFTKKKHLESSDNSFGLASIYFDGWWQDKKYYLNLPNWINYKAFQLDEINSKFLVDIKHSASVALHIRRGDYTETQFSNKYGNVCTTDYYKEAIRFIKKEFNNPTFYIFSDDIEWTKNNLPLENAVYMSQNAGKNSFLDMYLMSHCKANIIANSTFSYWGAYLNKNNPIVIYPKKWFNTDEPAPDIFKPTWLGI